MVILNLGQLEDNHFLLYIFINATINVSNAMTNIPKLIIKDKASEIFIIRLTSFLCNNVKEVHLLLLKDRRASTVIILNQYDWLCSCYHKDSVS